MKSTSCFLALFICLVLITDAVGFWSRRGVGLSSSSKRKRDLPLYDRQEDLTNVGIQIPYSSAFSVYDTNKDQIITLDEFQATILSHINLDNPDYLIVVFMKADTNGDGELDESEFLTAPWDFADDGDDEELKKPNDLI